MSIVFFDLETGGLLASHPNIQLAAVAVNDALEELEHYEAKIQFNESDADLEALKMNHYDRGTWEERAIPVRDVILTFSSFLKRHSSIEMVSKRTGNPYSVARLAGHNVVTFDVPRLQAMYGREFLPAHPQALDTLQLALWRMVGAKDCPKSNKLTDLCEFFGIEIPDAHDALADVRGSIAIARAMTAQAVAA